MLFIQAPTRLRLRLLRSGFQASVSIREKEIELLNITDAIPEELGLQDWSWNNWSVEARAGGGRE